MRTAELVDFMFAREARRKYHHDHKVSAVPEPDEILDTYRFCNVLRNDDRVTKWLHDNWLARWRTELHGWFPFAVARCAINRIDTMAAIEKYLMPWKPEQVRRVLKERRAQGLTIYGAAYMIGTQGNAGDKVDFLIDKVLTPLWKNRLCFPCDTGFTHSKQASLAVAHEWLQSHYAVGSFTAAQVLADWKYANGQNWRDFDTFAASGPGSRRGLNRVLNQPLNNTWDEKVFRTQLGILRNSVLPLIKHDRHIKNITAQDLQNCLCEFDKYERARLGEGRPKQIYTPHKEDEA